MEKINMGCKHITNLKNVERVQTVKLLLKYFSLLSLINYKLASYVTFTVNKTKIMLFGISGN